MYQNSPLVQRTYIAFSKGNFYAFRWVRISEYYVDALDIW